MNPRARKPLACNSRLLAWSLLAVLTACCGPAGAQITGQIRPSLTWDGPRLAYQAAPSTPSRVRRASANQPAPVMAAPVMQPGMVVEEEFLGPPPVVTEEHAHDGGWSRMDVCPPTWYASAAFAYFNNNASENFTRSRHFALDDFEFVEGMQITFGRMFDCTEGWEFIYTGPFQWRNGKSFNDPFNDFGDRMGGGNLQSTWVLGDPTQGALVAAELSAFNDAVYHAQRYESQLHSFEFHSKTWGWDVFAFTLGARYIRYDEEFAFIGINRQQQAGLFLQQTQNDLIGPQLGAEFRYPFLPGWSFSSKYKGGLYANFTDSSTRLSNAGAEILRNSDDGVSLAFMVEVGGRLNRNFGNFASVFVGYDLWYADGLALASEQTGSTLFRNSGRSINDNGDIWLSGVTAGVELSW